MTLIYRLYTYYTLLSTQTRNVMLVDTVRSDVHDCRSYKDKDEDRRSRRPDIITNVCGWTKLYARLHANTWTDFPPDD